MDENTNSTVVEDGITASVNVYGRYDPDHEEEPRLVLQYDFETRSHRGAHMSSLDFRDVPYHIMTERTFFGCDMTDSLFGGLDLSQTSFRVCDFEGSSFAGCDLRGTFLWKCQLRNCDFKGAHINWQDRTVISELLRRAAEEDWSTTSGRLGARKFYAERMKVAGMPLMVPQWCWQDFTGLDDPLQSWALHVLAGYVDEEELYNVPSPLRAAYRRPTSERDRVEVLLKRSIDDAARAINEAQDIYRNISWADATPARYNTSPDDNDDTGDDQPPF